MKFYDHLNLVKRIINFASLLPIFAVGSTSHFLMLVSPGLAMKSLPNLASHDFYQDGTGKCLQSRGGITVSKLSNNLSCLMLCQANVTDAGLPGL